MEKLLRLALIVAWFVMGIIMSWSGEAQAIPAFSRTHQAPCTLCHVGFPKLNHFGVHFMMRGYRMPRQTGQYLWEQPVPLSGRINLGYQSLNLNLNREPVFLPAGISALKDTKSSSLGVDNWQILAGGTLTPRISFLSQIVGYVERSGADTTDELPQQSLPKSREAYHTNGLYPGPLSQPMESDTLKTDIQTEDLHIQINDLLANDMLNLRMGRYHVDNHFLSTPHRLTQAAYLIQIQTVLGPTLEATSVGAELNGYLPIGLHYFTGIRNYGPAYNSEEGDEQRVGAYYALVNQTFKGQTASLVVSRDRLGDANRSGPGQDDLTLGYGASLDLHFGNFNVIPGLYRYQEGRKYRDGNELNVSSGTVEAIYPILPALLGTLRYDTYKRDLKGDSRGRDARQYVVSLSWYPAPPIRFVFEYSRLETGNLVMISLPDGPLMIPTLTEGDITQDTMALLVEANF